MAIWKEVDPLKEFDVEELVALKDAAVEYLRENLLDEIGCAEKLGLDTLSYFSLKSLFAGEFDEVRLLVVSHCEKYIADVGTGKIVGEEISAARLSTCKWIVERKSQSWIKTTKSVVKNDGSTTEERPNGQGRAMVEARNNGNAKVRSDDYKH